MVVTELGGEWRFASAVSKRMANLGALTKGNRRAAMGTDLHKFDTGTELHRFESITPKLTCEYLGSG